MQRLRDIKTKISFGMIVLNGMPLIEYNLKNLYPFAYQIIIVEGACVAGKSLADNKGHSIDGTLEFLYKFKKENDPDNKLIIIKIENEINNRNFWIEKTEMCQAFAKRAKGDWLWQVDSDEFYKKEDMIFIINFLQKNPHVSGIELPYVQFYGGFDYIQQGQWFKYNQPNFDRIFKWDKNYKYVYHRPPTIIDNKGRDLRTLNWVKWQYMYEKKIFLYHYSYIFPKQAEEKVGYYSNVDWTDEYKNIYNWLEKKYLKYPCWLEYFNGKHPEAINNLIYDIQNKKINIKMRDIDDIEELLNKQLYFYGKKIFNVLIFFKWYFYKVPVSFLKQVLLKILKKK